MHADGCHPEIASILASKLLWETEAVETSLVGEFPRLGQECFPVVTGKSLIVPVCTGILPTVVEESLVVVAGLERGDLGGDEVVDFPNVSD